MNIILFEDKKIRESLLPFTFTRPIGEIRVGILKIAEKWSLHLKAPVSFIVEPYLSGKFEVVVERENLHINSAVCPNQDLVKAIEALGQNEVLKKGDLLVAYYDAYIDRTAQACKVIELPFEITTITKKHDIFVHNGAEIKKDFELITKGRVSQEITDKFTAVYGVENIFIEEGAKVKACVLNAEQGPIYIGKDAEIKEGALVRGPFALLDHSVINMGAKIQGDTTIGPHCKIGGEVSNTVVFGYSNKGHEGFVGNSVIGEWCNLGADTNTSNLKNNYSNIKVWDYASNDYVDTKRQFHGLMMGDHSKAGINTMFNTGTVVGVSANIYGGNFPPKFIPSFAWGGSEGFETFKFELAMETAQRVYDRRGLKLDEETIKVLKHVFDAEAPRRHFFNIKPRSDIFDVKGLNLNPANKKFNVD